MTCPFWTNKVGVEEACEAVAGLINGSFELPLESGVIPGWTKGGSSVTYVQASWAAYSEYGFPSGYTYTPKEGTKLFAFFCRNHAGDEKVTQTVSATAGQVISGWAAFDLAEVLGYGTYGRIRILDGATVVATVFSDYGSVDGADGAWTYWEHTVTASASLTIELSGNADSGSSGGYIIVDDVRLT